VEYWNALKIINQVAAQTGMTQVTTLVAPDDANAIQTQQFLAALNMAGSELLMYYPWEQFRREWVFFLQANIGSYDLPPGWAYFIDQTQWDRTNHWPLLGPKNAAEWAWLKGGLLASFPRMRFRVMKNKWEVFPIPESNSQFEMAMEYMVDLWVASGTSPDGLPDKNMIDADGDVVCYNPWLAISYTKLKWMQLKGFDQTAAAGDFKRIFDSLTGKDVGAPVLSLVPRTTPFLIGPWSVPDGNWNVT